MILSRDIGIDLGTATTMICDRKGRIIVREPSVVAVDVKTKRVVATGTHDELLNEPGYAHLWKATTATPDRGANA